MPVSDGMYTRHLEAGAPTPPHADRRSCAHGTTLAACAVVLDAPDGVLGDLAGAPADVGCAKGY